MLEVWTLAFPAAGRGAAAAEMAEKHGWDGILFADSQNLTSDVYVTLTEAALRTSRVKIGTGVTNPVTRHAAVTACAIASVNALAKGRAVLGLGRGDSAVAHLGEGLAPLKEFERYLADVQSYLRGQVVDAKGFPSRIEWIDGSASKPLVDVAATGPRVIAAGARLADRVSLTVGACPARVRWGIELARRAREEARLDPDGLAIGAYVNCVAHPDRAVARNLLRGSMGTLIRFSGMDHASSVGLPAGQRAQLTELARSYSIRQHAMGSAAHSAALDDDLIDALAVVGPSDYCLERLSELVQLGLQSLVIAGHSRDADPALLAETSQRFTEEVLPQLHRLGLKPSPAG
jgi:5,10-methylenetetrahydromethanopterin reductase